MEQARAFNLSDIERIDREFLLAKDIAPALGVDPQDIRGQAQVDSTKLGFPVIVTGTRVRIPKEAFLFFCRFGNPRPIGDGRL